MTIQSNVYQLRAVKIYAIQYVNVYYGHQLVRIMQICAYSTCIKEEPYNKELTEF